MWKKAHPHIANPSSIFGSAKLAQLGILCVVGMVAGIWEYEICNILRATKKNDESHSIKFWLLKTGSPCEGRAAIIHTAHLFGGPKCRRVIGIVHQTLAINTYIYIYMCVYIFIIIYDVYIYIHPQLMYEMPLFL